MLGGGLSLLFAGTAATTFPACRFTCGGNDMLSQGCAGAAVLGVTPMTPLPAHAPFPTGTGGAQGSHCSCAFALRKGFQGGTRAVGMPLCEGVAVALLGRGGIANVV